MSAEEFYNNMNDKVKAVAILCRNDCLDEENVTSYHHCKGEMKQALREWDNSAILPTLYCRTHNCQTCEIYVLILITVLFIIGFLFTLT